MEEAYAMKSLKFLCTIATYGVVKARFPHLPACLKPKQVEVLNLLSQGKNVLAILPTGYGKTLTFVIPALLSHGKISLVISPLKALMAVQVDSLAKLGISAVAVTQANEMTDDIIKGKNMSSLCSM